MKIQRFIHLGTWVVTATFLLSNLIACGEDGNNSFADGGIGGTGVVAAGTVTAKGSIFVNGIEYNVAGATFERDDDSATLTEDESLTQVGMILEVKGTINEDGLTGQATEILFSDVVEGTIDSATSESAAIKVLSILAQQVIVEDGLTKFSGILNFSNIDSNNGFLEVSGFRRADGQIEATYIEPKPMGQFEVTGPVTVVNSTSFAIGDLAVTYNGLPLLQTGDLVKAEGNNYSSGAQTLVATSVNQQSSGLSIDDADQAEVEGFVSGGAGTTPIPAGSTFQVNGQNVQFTATTEFVGGTADALINNIKVETEGPLADGILQAEKIKFEENIKLQGTVASVTASSLTLVYPDDRNGTDEIVVSIDPVITEEDSPFAEIKATDYVKLEGRLLGNGNMVLATKLKELDPDDRTILQAPVESFNTTTGFIRMLGVDIDTNGLSLSENDTPITQSEFFNALQASSGTLVKARSDLPGQWEELELER